MNVVHIIALHLNNFHLLLFAVKSSVIIGYLLLLHFVFIKSISFYVFMHSNEFVLFSW